MTVQASVVTGAATSARRTTLMDIVRQPAEEGYQVPSPDVSGVDRVNGSLLDFAESQEFNYGVMGVTAAASATSAAATAVAGGAGVAAASTAAAASLGSFAVVVGAGILGGIAGNAIGTAAADFVFGTLMGRSKVATEGDTPARYQDPIAHVSKNAGLWGAIVGAVAAVAVVGFAILTFGAGLLVLAAAAAVAGLAAGGIAGFASTAGQYGANKGKIEAGSADVFFEGRPVARVGDPISCSDHGPMLIAEGAKTVFANDRNIARTGHRTTCDANINDGTSTIVQTVETATVFEVQDSRSPLLRWANVVVNLLPMPRAKGPGGAPRPNTRTTSTSGRGSSNGKSSTAGEPVDMATGDFLQVWPVLDLPGTIPLRLGRCYRSTAAFAGLFGGKWADDWSQRLELGAETVTYHTPEGVELDYHTPDDEVHALNLREGRYCLSGQRSGVLRLYDRQTRTVLSFAEADGDTRRLTDIEDLNGNRIRFEYRERQLHRICHSDGFQLDVECAGGRLRTLRLSSRERDGASLVRCAYDGHGYLAECASHQFGVIFHVYDAQGRMRQWRDTDRTRAHVEYDDRDRVIATSSDSGHYADRFEYDDVAGCVHYHDAEGGHTAYHYNADGLVTRVVDPLGHEWLTEWDDLTNKLSETDPLGRTTRYEYNEFGEVTGVVAPDGGRQSFEYDANGAMRAVTRADGAQWQFFHDARGNPTGMRDPYGRRVGYRLGARGEVLRREMPDGSQWRYAYDERHRLREVVAPDGATTRLREDIFGRVLEAVDALGQVTRYEYDAGHASPAGSVGTVILPDGTRQDMAYDSERRLVAHTDGEGRTTRYRYGAFDLLQSLDPQGGGGLRFDYDRLTRLTAVTNGEQETYCYGYDAAGRRVSETDYGGATTHYAYNPVGWLTEEHRPDGSQIRYDHDIQSGRLLTIHRVQAQPGDTEPVETQTRLEYDDNGNLLKIANADATIEYERDGFGRVLAERLNGREVRYEYDPATGLPLGQTAGHRVRWEFDVHGALRQLGVDAHAPLRIDRDSLGRDVRRHSAVGFNLRQDYDALGLLTAQRAGGTEDVPSDPRLPSGTGGIGLPGGGAAVQRSYRYDRAFNPVQIDDERWGATRYRYDANSQVIAAHLDGTPGHAPLEEGFHYDGAQNLVARIRSKLPGVERQDLRQQAGRVVQRGRDRYRYDKLGRLVEKTVHVDGFRPQHWRYRWDGEDRLAECVTPQGEHWRYAYDGLGRRIRKFKVIAGGAEKPAARPDEPDTSVLRASAPERIIVPPRGGGRGAADGGSAARVVGEEYLWAGDQLIEAAPIYADGTVAYDRATRWAYAPGAVTPLAQQRGDRLWYIVTDQVGTPRELLDEAGELAWSNSPKLWGQQRLWRRPAANDDAVDCPLRFPGQYYDEESGLHYNRHRYYDPETAQYLTPDPLGLAGGVRPQSYVGNPNSWIDPLGLATCSAGTRNQSVRDRLPGPEVPEYHRNNFTDGKYTNRQVSGDEVFYKYHGVDNRTGRTHNYVTKKKYSSESELRNDLAILDEWGITIDRVTTFKPAAGTWISEGTAAKQVGRTGEVRSGRGYQGLIDIKNLPNSTVIRTGKLKWP